MINLLWLFCATFFLLSGAWHINKAFYKLYLYVKYKKHKDPKRLAFLIVMAIIGFVFYGWIVYFVVTHYNH